MKCLKLPGLFHKVGETFKILRAEKHLVEDVLKSLYNPIPPWLLDGNEDGLDAQMKAEAYHKPKGVRIPITPS